MNSVNNHGINCVADVEVQAIVLHQWGMSGGASGCGQSGCGLMYKEDLLIIIINTSQQ